MNDKQAYLRFCENSKNQIPVFFTPWWLDAVCENDWESATIYKGDDFHAAWVYQRSSKYLFNRILTPPLTPYHGMIINYPPEQKPATKRSFEKKTIEALIKKLPAFDYLDVNLHPELTNWHPLYSSGFSQTTRYTYRLNTTKEVGELWNNLNPSTRKAVKKARDRFGITVVESKDFESFYNLHTQTFQRKDSAPPHTKSLFQKLETACSKNNARKIFIAEDEKGQKQSAVYLVFDEHNVYYLAGGTNPDFKNTEAATLVMWHAIEYAAKSGFKVFDFEGSMIESIASFFSAFGTEQIPYHRITKANHPLFKLIKR